MSPEVLESLNKVQEQLKIAAKLPQINIPEINFPKVGDYSPVYKVIYRIVSGKFIEYPNYILGQL